MHFCKMEKTKAMLAWLGEKGNQTESTDEPQPGSSTSEVRVKQPQLTAVEGMEEEGEQQ